MYTEIMLIDPVPEEIVQWFVENITPVIKGKRIKIWLAKRSRHRVDTLAAVGLNQPYPIKLFDHGAGFYLFGEGVTPDMLAPIHKVFAEFCRRMKDAKSKNIRGRLEVNYRSVQQTDPYWYNRVVMHYPFSAPAHKRRGEDEI